MTSEALKALSIVGELGLAAVVLFFAWYMWSKMQAMFVSQQERDEKRYDAMRARDERMMEAQIEALDVQTNTTQETARILAATVERLDGIAAKAAMLGGCKMEDGKG